MLKVHARRAKMLPLQNEWLWLTLVYMQYQNTRQQETPQSRNDEVTCAENQVQMTA